MLRGLSGLPGKNGRSLRGLKLLLIRGTGKLSIKTRAFFRVIEKEIYIVLGWRFRGMKELKEINNCKFWKTKNNFFGSFYETGKCTYAGTQRNYHSN